ncbi:MAG TPA: hypothetical protein PKX00_08875 [Opitutaceae bacterium]|jgi:hypothetical protein|nr:hypothetical protein [Opitutaceae bacterium]
MTNANAKLVMIAGLTVLFAGCAIPFRAPSDVAAIQLERVDSPTVIVEKIWLERKSGQLVVKGYVLKRLNAGDTDDTHLDVTLYDAQGQELRSTVDHFEPRHLMRRFRRPPYGSYRVPLDPLPVGTLRIQVRAHEGTHVGQAIALVPKAKS